MSTGQDSGEQTGSIAIFEVMGSDEKFASSAVRLWTVIAEAADEHPAKPRHLYLEIKGHRNPVGELDAEASLLMDEFLTKVLMPYVDEAHTPRGVIRNPNGQRGLPRQMPPGDMSVEAVAELAEFAERDANRSGQSNVEVWLISATTLEALADAVDEVSNFVDGSSVRIIEGRTDIEAENGELGFLPIIPEPDGRIGPTPYRGVLSLRERDDEGERFTLFILESGDLRRISSALVSLGGQVRSEIPVEGLYDHVAFHRDEQGHEVGPQLKHLVVQLVNDTATVVACESHPLA